MQTVVVIYSFSHTHTRSHTHNWVNNHCAFQPLPSHHTYGYTHPSWEPDFPVPSYLPVGSVTSGMFGGEKLQGCT